jgi:hypothetical protein
MVRCTQIRNEKKGKIYYIIGFPRGFIVYKYYIAIFPWENIYYIAIFPGGRGSYYIAIFPEGTMARGKADIQHRSHSKERPIWPPFPTRIGILRAYSQPEPHGSPFIDIKDCKLMCILLTCEYNYS